MGDLYRLLVDEFEPSSFDAKEYADGALGFLVVRDVLSDIPAREDRADCTRAVEAVDLASLDMDDNAPWAVIYALAAQGLLDDQTRAAAVDWREWVEGDYGITLDLPRRIEKDG